MPARKLKRNLDLSKVPAYIRKGNRVDYHSNEAIGSEMIRPLHIDGPITSTNHQVLTDPYILSGHTIVVMISNKTGCVSNAGSARAIAGLEALSPAQRLSTPNEKNESTR